MIDLLGFTSFNPTYACYAQKYGLAVQNTRYNFFESGQLKSGANFITRFAPAVGKNIGGELEVVTDANDVELKLWHMR